MWKNDLGRLPRSEFAPRRRGAYGAARGEKARAQSLFGEAADLEAKALASVAPDLQRTYGITAVSAVALRWKSGARNQTLNFGRGLLAGQSLPSFAKIQIESILGKVEPKAAPSRGGVAGASPILVQGPGPKFALDAHEALACRIYCTFSGSIFNSAASSSAVGTRPSACSMSRLAL